MKSKYVYTQLPLFPEFVADKQVEQDDDEWDPSPSPLYEGACRLFQLVQTLGSRQCTREELVRRLPDFYIVSEEDRAALASSQRVGKKVIRDIAFLRSLGYEINVTGRGMKTLYHLRPGTGPTIFFADQQSLITLSLLRALFIDPVEASTQPNYDIGSLVSNNPFAQDIVSLIQSMVSQLPDEQQRYFTRLVRKPSIYFHLDLTVDYNPHRATIEKIAGAIRERRRIRFDYQPGYRREMTHHYEVDPHRIVHQDGHLYLLGYSYKMNDFFELRLDRIHPESVSVLNESINSMRHRSPMTFRYWADESLVKNGVSQRWLTATIEREETYLDAQGRERRRALIRASAYSDWRVIQQLHKYGDKVELIEPFALRKKMMDEVERIYNIYHS